MKKILVIGESCTDKYTYGMCVRLAPEAPIPIITPIEEVSVGGMAMNVFSNIKSLGVEADLITNENWNYITKHRYVDLRTNQILLRIDIDDDKYGRIDLSDIQFDKYDAIIISDYDKGFLNIQDIEFISSNHNLVFLDTKKILGDWTYNVAFIKINEQEYKLSKKFITNRMNQSLIVTQGHKGCTYNNINFGVPEVDVKDTCGAGDTFISGLACHYIYTQNICESIEFANLCATQVIQKKGTGITTLKLKI